MIYGKIVKYVSEKKYGFIECDTGREVFFHISVLDAEDADKEITEGQPVKLEIAPRPRDEDGRPIPFDKLQKPRAKIVKLIDKLPGGISPFDGQERERRHPKARKKKPTWRR